MAAIQIKCVFRCGCLIFWIPNLAFTCFTCAGVNEKYHCLNIGDDTPHFGDKNVEDMKDAHAVDSDQEAPFAPDYKRVKTTGRDAQPLCIGRPPDAAWDCPRRTKRVAPVNRRCHQVGPQRFEFLGLTKTGLSDIDGERLASALAASPRRDAKNSPGKERLDLTWSGCPGQTV